MQFPKGYIGISICIDCIRRFLHNEALSRQKEARSRDYALFLFRMTSMVLYNAQYHRQHCKRHVFEQNRAHYSTTTMTNIQPDRDSKLLRSGYKPQTIRMGESGVARYRDKTNVKVYEVMILLC